MNCKHAKIEGDTTKYYFCKLKGKAIDNCQCSTCMMRIPDVPDGFEELFRGVRK